MTVNLTRIYTRLGDDGQTHLGDMSRVSKIDPRVEAYGTVNELNAAIGLARAQSGLPERFEQWLARVQNDLLDAGADMCVPDPGPAAAGEAPGGSVGGEGPDDGDQMPGGRDGGDSTPTRQPTARERLRLTADYIRWLEEACDEVNAQLPPLRSFVIPGGSPAAAHLHVCRTVCRRAERRAIAAGSAVNQEVVRYLNRLSDLLFILARGVTEGPEPLWEPGAHRPGAH